MKFFILSIFFFLSTFANAAFDDAVKQENIWETLPRNRPFPLIVADTREIRTALRKNSRNELEAEVGTYRSVIGWQGVLLGEKSTAHFGLEGNGYYIMRQDRSRFPLYSTDGLLGFYLEAAQKNWAVQMRYTHISAHLSDDGIASGRAAIEYSREFIHLRSAHPFLFFGEGFAYLGYQYLVNTTPNDIPKHGADFGFSTKFGKIYRNIRPYFGADYKIKNAHEGSTWNLTTGIEISSTQGNAGSPPIRFAAHYLSGHDPRGQFYSTRLKKFSAGLEVDL